MEKQSIDNIKNEDVQLNQPQDFKSLFGLFRVSSSAPSGKPTKFADQIVIYDNGSIKRVCIYDPKNDEWVYDTASYLNLDQTSPQTFTGGTVTGTGLLKVVDGELGLDTNDYVTAPPVARVYSSATISFTDSTETVINWNLENFDIGSLHNTSTNTSRLTCSSAGKYMIIACVGLTTGVTYDFRILVNGSAIANSIVSTGGYKDLSTIYSLSSTDYVQVSAKTYGANATLDNTYSHFEMYKISD